MTNGDMGDVLAQSLKFLKFSLIHLFFRAEDAAPH
jgi:hypothetical protein